MDKISYNIPNQFPLTYLERGPNFVAFVRAYYEWLEQTNNPVWYIRNFLDLNDIDKTLEEFLIHFKNEYMYGLPISAVTNERLLIKHITDLYNAKGSKRGYELLFRILFNETIETYLPSANIFKPSDNEWVQDRYIEVTDNIYLPLLEGTLIRGATSNATALVENYNVINDNNKSINVLHISNLNGEFQYNDKILSDEVSQLNADNAPIVRGSLKSVSLENGGINFNVGDIVNITGSGLQGLGRVASIEFERGKIIFNLVDGGFGYTMNPVISVTGGGGSGANFFVGGLTNQIIYKIDLDVINDYYNVAIDNEAYTLTIDTSGSFTVGEYVNASVNAVSLDFQYLNGINLQVGETLSNSSLGISSLLTIFVDNPNFTTVIGPNTSLYSANLISNAVLVGGTSGSLIKVNMTYNYGTVNASGIVTSDNSTIITVSSSTGYFFPNTTITGQTSGTTALIANTSRTTDWGFPVPGPSNLDSTISSVLTIKDLTIGTITRLIKENPGQDYTSNVTISIVEPYISQLQISDNKGNVWGNNAVVTGYASGANGVVTSLQVVDSGYGFAQDEEVFLYSNNNYAATGHAVLGGSGITNGYWKNRKSFLSDEMYIQDSYYYQKFSYEIIAPRMLKTYDKFIKDLVHPVGYQLFGKLKITDVMSSQTSIANTISKKYVNSSITYIGP